MATVEGIDYDACLDFYRDRFADASDFVFVFVGSFDLAEMRPLIEQYLGGLPASQRKETWRDVEAEGPEGIVERSVFAGQDDKSQTGIYWSGDFEWTRRNRYVISSLSEHLDTVMREALREDLGGTYGVSVSATRGRDPKPQYSFSVGFGSAPDRVDELVTELWRVVADLKANPPTAEDVQKITEGQRRSYEQGLQENGWWLSQIQFRHRYDRPQDETLEFLDLVDSLSAEELSEAARRYLLEDAFVRVSLYPEGYDGGQ
jgi:zinc protease